MNCKEGYFYHIYNRGNNRDKIFFEHRNYLFFINKTRHELLPYFHFLAYCLMPDHFHFLVKVKEIHELDEPYRHQSSDDTESSDESVLSRHISNRIAILLRSYTRAVNKQENRTGSLFQQKTKAKCINDHNNSPVDYSSVCFHYIHQNPFRAGLVENLSDWEYSSFLDYAGIRNGTLCNRELAFEIVNYNRDNFIAQSYAIIDEKKLRGIWT